MNILSVVILSYAIDDEIYQMNCNCIESLFNSEDWKENNLSVLLIESNKDNIYIYDDRVKVIIPDESFNFNRFLNIGIERTNSDLVALCNNDIIFSKDWFSELLKVKKHNKNFLCFSSIDRDYESMSYDIFPEEKDYYIGWDNKYHFAAWCFVLDKRIFNIIGKLDETFSFYYADDDFLMTLRKYTLDNVLLTHSHVKHLSQAVTKKEKENNSHAIFDKQKYPLTDKQLKLGLSWLWDDDRFYEAYFKMENKWGNERMIRRINRVLYKYSFLRKRFMSKILYNKNLNLLLAKLTGI